MIAGRAMKHFQAPATLTIAPHGLGLRTPHLNEVSWTRPAVDFFEVHPENYILDKARLETLTGLRADYPLSLHAVGLSLGSHDGLDADHVAVLRDLVNRLDPLLVSDHLSWNTVDGIFLNDLLPLPYTREALDIFARNLDCVQTALKRQILVENPSGYVRFRGNEFEEQEFLRRLVARTGCGLLLDINNVFVSATNLGFDATGYLKSFPFEAVREFHLAGHHRKEVNGETILIDDHGSAVTGAVWALFADAVARAPSAATLIEWDSNIPPLDILLEQRDRAQSVSRSAIAPRTVPSLAALQTGMAKVLLSAKGEDDDLGFAGHLSIYRNNVRESLTEALRAVYSGVEALVGKAFFRQSALRFIEINPPRMPALASYGEEFAEFLDGLPSCRSIPYLGDVARLEWRASRASLHRAGLPIAPDLLKSSMDWKPGQLCFTAQEGLSHFACAFPIDEIWTFAQAGGEGSPPQIQGNPVFLEIAPGQEGVTIRRLEEAEFKFREALCAGADLATAANRALEVDPFFILFAALRSVLSDGIFTDCRIGQSQFEEVTSCMC